MNLSKELYTKKRRNILEVMSGALAGGATAEKLRPIAVATCMEVIGHDEGTIIAAATKCISKWTAFDIIL